MSGYLGRGISVSIPNLSGVDLEVSGIAQKKVTNETVVVSSDENLTYFGDTTFTGDVTINGSLIVIGGNLDFQGDVNIVGSLIYR